MKTHLLIVVIAVFSPSILLADDPGLVVVVGEEPAPLQLALPALSPYKFAYDPMRISLWDTVAKDNLIPPNTEYTAPTLAGDSEPDCDVDLDDFADFQICFTGTAGGPVGPACAPFDFESDTDVDLIDYTVFENNVSGPQCGTVSLSAFVEGLIPSAALGDVTIDLLTDPDGDGTFDLQETQAVTVISIDVSPVSGPPGTPLTVTLQPAIAPIAFDAATTGDWEGVYQPPLGPPTAPFQTAYDAAQFRESSGSQAILIVGDGSTTNAPDFANLDGPGTTPGIFTFHLAGHSLGRTFTFAPEMGASSAWHSITYDDTSTDTGPPLLGAELDTLNLMELSSDPDPLNPVEGVLLSAYAFHLVAVARIEENAATVAEAPDTIDVDLVSYDSAGLELDSVAGLVLAKVAGDDGDPDRIIYHSDLDTPIIMVDVALNKDNYPSVVLLQTESGGSAVVVAATD
ncbi:MAG TPA: hypothetical protein VM243_05305 [Phycisphaerae bacterium]|nr:hypothetical protein [Phycisphaerae bacterium]